MESSKLLAQVVYQGKDKSVDFYEDRVEFNGNSINYADITEITPSYSSVTYNFVIGWLTSKITIRSSTQMMMLKKGGFSIFGIGNKKSATKVFESVFNEIYNIVALSVAKKYVERTRAGEIIAFGRFQISSDGIVYKDKLVINKDNFESFQLGSMYGYIFPVVLNEKGKAAFSANLKQVNLILISHIFNELSNGWRNS